MQAIILAAGVGRRMGKLTQDSTKCMVVLNGRRIIEYTLDAIRAAGIKKVVLVIGHGAEEVRSFLSTRYQDLNIEYVVNPIYATSNNIYSLFLAREYLKNDDNLLLESDLIFDQTIIPDCLNAASPNLIVVAKYESWMDGTVVQLDAEQSVTRFIPKENFDWTQTNQYFKTVNIYKLSKDFCQNTFLPFLETYIKVKGLNEYYEEVFKLLTPLHTFKALAIEDKYWYEIDTLQDLEIASLLFSDSKTKSHLLQKRFGGYWRFPKIKDFCYLVNPYFPPKLMLEEIKASFSTLISAYPSGLDTQNMMAASIFNCEPSQITVGNGASELIRALFSHIKGKIGIPVPTFDEYPGSIAKQQLIEFSSFKSRFQYTVEDVLNFCRQEKELSAFILINPDNPSGHFFPKSQLIQLVEGLQEMSIKLILDESFVDFAEINENHSLIDAEILQRYENLIVIKSLGKSYGVAGIRLGVVASSNTQIIAEIKNNLPIWNINAFAECFLQIFDKYTAQYRKACEQLILDRQLLFRGLNDISFLKPINSSANFILCEMSEKFHPEFLVNKLLDEKWLLIKDCSDKRGFENNSYLRIAVRNTADNNYLIQCLKDMDT
ncbi:hypothetical protein PN36_27470 [Candidatus Thiomargarita nelsonii]|uniref:Aminotransferase n=1 Tax=Candidatus Thiomargarita nelsonii TaxID=1003181 RepID=A0A0A6PHZ8_9GAMM|nr:hypothetical protein PN36_27470 [Candidatus Thiomargarita nelsonii]